VDEFQDTSHLQMSLLQCLTDGWQDGDGRHRTLFMVGDPMQSIYRFRKAEVGLFLNAANNEAGLPLVEALQLERNFRSSPAIVEWVNRAFQSIFPAKQNVISGAVAHAPALAALKHDGAVNLHLQHGKDSSLEADCVVRLVQDALANPTSQGRRQRIAVLARSRKHLHTIMSALQAANIAFRAINILPLNARPEIRLLRALLRALLHPADRESWATILRSACCGLESHDMAMLLAGHDKQVWQLMQDDELIRTLSIDAQARVQSIRVALAPCIAMSGKVSVRDMLQVAWLRLSMPALIDASASLNVDESMALVETLEQGGRVDFALLDERLEKLYAAPDVSEAAESVELMTMHGAKGLQWDVVILPGLGHKGANVDAPLLAFSEVPIEGGAMPLMAVKASTRQKDALYSLVNSVEKSKGHNELQRLLYVACTRSETTLHMLGHVSETKGEAATGSLLELLIGEDECCFGAQIFNIEADEDQLVTADRSSLERVGEPLDLLVLSTDRDVELLNHHELETEYLWAGAEAAPVGNALHAALQHIADVGIEHWSDADLQRELEGITRMLIAEGLSGGLLKAASQRCADGLQRVLASEKGQWILSHQHQDAHSEWALSLENDGFVSHNIIDRSFIDEQGIRWIIDYKTASHEGGSLDEFLREERKRHASQLQRYSSILKNMEPDREIKTALYFPMLDAWVEDDDYNDLPAI